jgi:hypothetical protein
MLDEHNIVHRPTTVKNPQANAICERPHQTAANALRVLIHAHPPQNVDNAACLIDTALSTAACSALAATHSHFSSRHDIGHACYRRFASITTTAPSAHRQKSVTR